MDSMEAAAQIDKTALQILASSVGTILGEQSKIHQFVKLAAERPSSINMDRARRTFDALPVYQRKRVAETAEGVAMKQKSSTSMAAILNRLGTEAPKARAKSAEPAPTPDTKAPVKKVAREVAWK
jgi:hypothetical protein